MAHSRTAADSQGRTVLALQVARQPGHEEEQEVAEDEEGPIVREKRAVGQQFLEHAGLRPGFQHHVRGRGDAGIDPADMGELGCIHEARLRRVVPEAEIPERNPGGGEREQHREGEAPVEPSEKHRHKRTADRQCQRHRQQRIRQRRRPLVR
jgi:hypothetical protein